jgi:hypothetical protein
VQWNEATGTPAAIFGRGLDMPGHAADMAEARRRATATLDTHAVLLGRGNSTFVEDIAAKMNNVWSFVYRQQFKGLDVIGGRADVRVHQNGGISMFGAVAFPIPAAFAIVPGIDVTTARKTAYASQHVAPPAAPAALPTDRLVIWGDPDSAVRFTPRLAWEVRIDRPDVETVGRAYIDAVANTLLAYVNDWHTCSWGCTHGEATPAPAENNELPVVVTEGEPLPGLLLDPLPPVVGTVHMWANTGLKPTDALKVIPCANVKVQVVGGNSDYTDNTGAFSVPHNDSNPQQVVVEFIGRYVANVTPRQGTKMRVQVAATPGVPVQIVIFLPNAVQHDFAQSTAYWGTDEINRYLRGLNMTLPTRIDQIIAYTSLTSTCNAHYSGNTINFYANGGSCNMTCYSTVIFHEWGHGIDDAYGGISQTDGLSEGWGDLLAIYRSGQPILGDAFYTNGNFVRTALNTYTFPAGGGVHQQGQTWMGFAWDLRANLIASMGNAGIAVAEKIVVPTLAADAKNQPDAVREVFIADDDDNNLNNGVPHYTELEAAALKRRLPFPLRKFCDFDASFAAYGAGCRTAPQSCAVAYGQNWPAALANQTTTATKIGVLDFGRPQTNICGIDLFTKSRSGDVTVTVGIAEFATNGVPGPLLASGQVSVGTTEQIYSVKLPPTLVAKDAIYIIVFDNADKLVLPTTTTGTDSLYYEWRSNAWVDVPKYDMRFVYRVYNETGGLIPLLANTGVPALGKSFSIGLSRAPTNRAALLFLGRSKTQWGALPLPFDLAAYGAPGCSLLAAGDLALTLTTSATGTHSLNLSPPLDKQLCSTSLYSQYIVLDPSANRLGFVFTNGGDARMGN